MADSVSSAINRWSGRPFSQRYREVLTKRQSLPVWHQKEEFLKALKDNQILILAGETGSGKTTQIPQFVLEAIDLDARDELKKFMIGCAQPRTAAAMSATRRVAEEMDVTVGEEVGYTVRFEDCSSSRTVLKYLTDGMLLREAMADPLLERYKVIILDEAHERSLATDVLLGLLKTRLLKNRPDLKLVVISATLEAAEKFQCYFCSAPPLIKVPGGLHPVEFFYEASFVNDYVEAAIKTAFWIHAHEAPGDVLVFLTGEEEIEYACRELARDIANAGDRVGPADIVALHSTLPPAMLQIVFQPAPTPAVEGGPPGRKIVISTSIAETSLAIDGIVYVVDPGFAKRKVYNPHICIESLLVGPISKASADQRGRRAGMTRPGKCFRLYSEKNLLHDGFPSHTFPEIFQSSLAGTILTLKKLGIDDFDFVDPPCQDTMIRELEVLSYMGALDRDANLTELGHIMCEFPLDPKMAKMLIGSPQFNCSNEILSISAMLLSVPHHRCFVDAREVNARFGHIHGDHLTLLNIYNAFKQSNEDLGWCNENFVSHGALKWVDNVRQQLSRIMERLDLKLCSTDFTSPDYSVNIRKAMLAGYFMQVAHLEPPGHYITGKSNQVVHLHFHSSSLTHKPEWVLYNEYVLTIKNFARTVTQVHGEWLIDIAPDYYDPSNFSHFARRQLVKLQEARR